MIIKEVTSLGREEIYSLKTGNLFFLMYLFIYLSLAVLGLHHYKGFFSGCGKGGLPFSCPSITLWELLLVESTGSMVHGLQQFLPKGRAALSYAGDGESSWIKDQTCVSRLAGRFCTTKSPGKPSFSVFKDYFLISKR